MLKLLVLLLTGVIVVCVLETVGATIRAVALAPNKAEVLIGVAQEAVVRLIRLS